MAISDITLRGLGARVIRPFLTNLIEKIGGTKQISSGLSSYGYDLTASQEVEIFKANYPYEVDPKRFDSECMVRLTPILDEYTAETYVVLPPYASGLATTVEWVTVPENWIGFMTTKSTYARCGLVSPPTVLEAGWEGQVTIEVSNTTPLPVRLYLGEGIGQVVFFAGDLPCEISYAKRKGKYQGQGGITYAKVT